MKTRIAIVAILTGCLFAAAPPASAGTASADTNEWEWPIAGTHEVGRQFDAPETQYSAGHRGVDLPGETGDAVTAVADGTVTFAGSVAGVGVVVIDHGDTQSTYQPVTAVVKRGQSVGAGTKIGTLVQRGSHCLSRPCLHLGRKVGDLYADPLELMRGRSQIRLVNPLGAPPAPAFARAGMGVLIRPVNGPVTSPFGMRVHPITGIDKLHDGTDFGVPCGKPVHAAARGVVRSIYFNAGYGKRLIIKHPGGLETSYNHLSRYAADEGDRVDAGQTIGYVGSTGYSTGCHLHFMVTVKGRAIDPNKWL